MLDCGIHVPVIQHTAHSKPCGHVNSNPIGPMHLCGMSTKRLSFFATQQKGCVMHNYGTRPPQPCSGSICPASNTGLRNYIPAHRLRSGLLFYRPSTAHPEPTNGCLHSLIPGPHCQIVYDRIFYSSPSIAYSDSETWKAHYSPITFSYAAYQPHGGRCVGSARVENCEKKGVGERRDADRE